jgi:hypothetical protein
MTSGTTKVRRIVAGKGAAAVMALKTIKAGSCPVFESGYARNLASLHFARLHCVAFITAFPSVISVAENDLRTILRGESPYVLRGLVAQTTGIVLILGSVTGITG